MHACDNADDQVYCIQTESVFVGAKYTTLYDEDRKYQLEKKAKQIVPAPFKPSHPPCVSPHLTPQAQLRHMHALRHTAHDRRARGHTKYAATSTHARICTSLILTCIHTHTAEPTTAGQEGIQ